MIARCGVPKRGWIAASAEGKTPARAMANRLREKISAVAFIVLRMASVAAPTITGVAHTPSGTRAASRSGASLRASASGPISPSAVAATAA